jgi:NADPH:quinone reductase
VWRTCRQKFLRLRSGRWHLVRSAVDSLALRGRLVEIAANHWRDVSFDHADFYHNESELFGVDTLNRGLAAAAEVLTALTPGFVAGDYGAALVTEAQEAYRNVAAGAAGPSFCRHRK